MERIDITAYPVKKLMTVPIAILVFSLLVLGYFYATTGSPVSLGVEFRGGTVVTIDTDKSNEVLISEFSDYHILEVRDSGNRKMLQFGPMSQSQKDELISKIGAEYKDYQLQDMGEQFGKTLQIQAIEAILFGFILMAIIVFLVFRTFVPSIAVILSAFSDIVITMAFMNLFGLELSFGTLIALLMLIGYSVDSDILLTTRLLKRKGPLDEKIRSTLKTGLTMTTTTISAMFAIFLVSTFSYLISSYTVIPVLRDISAVILIGLVVDIINTWMLNAGILRWYIENREKKEKSRAKAKKKSKKTGKKTGKKFKALMVREENGVRVWRVE